MVDSIAKDITPLERQLMEAFFPGPLTIILKRKDNVPDIVTASLDTVGIRMPSNKIAHDLIELASVPIAAPSANISGRPSGTNINDIFEVIISIELGKFYNPEEILPDLNYIKEKIK